MSLQERCDRLYDALQLMIDYVGDGCPVETYGYCMTEARAAMKGFRVVKDATPPLTTPD